LSDPSDAGKSNACQQQGHAYLKALNPQQREAVLHTGRPLLILAGAGSGKTRVITTKIAYLIDKQGLDPSSILAVAFTNKAADEMRDRVRSLTPAGGEVMIKTFHAFGAWLLRRYGGEIGIQRGFTICDDEDSFSLLKRIVREELGEALARHHLKELAAWIARAKDRCLLPEDEVLETQGVLPGLDAFKIYRLYQRRLKQSGCLDFGDLLVRTVELLERRSDVRERVRGRFRAILVDEYQDSNYAQFRLLQQLHDGQNYLCVVGDEDQSIYSFRGAELDNILSFSDKFSDTQIIRLEENYRSTQTILEVATRVVENNQNRLGKNLFTRKSVGSPVLLAYLEDPEAEALFCAERLERGGQAGRAKLAESAILYRMNFQSRVFESLFSRRGIPYRVVGTVRFYERQEVKDALAYLTLIVNPANELAFRRAIAKPRRGIGAKSLETILGQRGIEGNLLEAASQSLSSATARTTKGLRAFLLLLESIRENLSEGPDSDLSEMVHRLIMNSGLVDYYRERDESDGTDKVRNLEELINATAGYPASMEGLGLFLESLMLGASEEDPFLKTEKVTLITAHNTKGLEFDRVFITGLEDGIFPHYASTVRGLPVAGTELEEERRLFYVGVTRAREELYLTTCRKRRVFGTLQASQPSCFLSEIPREHLHVYGSEVAEEDGFGPGCGVYHDDYGPGIIIRKWETDGVAMVSVRFESGKIARFPLKYSRLERISTDP
jgi:DNA helicase-2/ATP-dependent DNA helicase PcrA